ncbi:class C sortase [Macrococcoides goetzii]|nr:class C sortase [Macrococcus goetzii]TDM39889.1 class C sortase [Macrococcus goetzii]
MKHIINLLFICGLLIAIYPIIAKIYYNYDSTKQAEQLDNSRIDEQTKSRYKQQMAYNDAVRSRKQQLTSPEVKARPKGKDAIMKKSEEIIATVKIPKLKLHYPVFDGATPENLNKGVSRVTGTSYPVGGLSTNSVLAAHSYSPFQEWFTHIDRLKNDDKVIVNNFKEKLTYQVYDRVIVTPDKVEAMDIKKGKDIITLLTCTPDGSKRLLIYAQRAPAKQIIKQQAQPIQQKSWYEQIKVLSDSYLVLCMVFIMTYIFLVSKRK